MKKASFRDIKQRILFRTSILFMRISLWFRAASAWLSIVAVHQEDYFREWTRAERKFGRKAAWKRE